MVKRFKRKIYEKDKMLLKQYRIKCLNNKIKRYGGLLIAGAGIVASVLFDLPIIGVTFCSVIPITLVMFIFSQLQ